MAKAKKTTKKTAEKKAAPAPKFRKIWTGERYEQVEIK
tara:strand:+ start:4102 stop:4215 length:114 start_codon:yes stop_codon:yes gene_type:complete